MMRLEGGKRDEILVLYRSTCDSTTLLRESRFIVDFNVSLGKRGC